VTGAFTLAANTGTVNAASLITGGGLTLPVAVAYDRKRLEEAAKAKQVSVSDFIREAVDAAF
jgi:hypothetical protein